MKVSLNWLKEYIAIDMSPADLAARLTMAGLEVEGVIERFQYLDTVLVGKIIQTRPHPNAEKLKLCDVRVGDRTLAIVCGAPNAKPNMNVPCALPGTILLDGLEIKKTAIRGETSEGMLCSEAELGLGPDKSGLMALSEALIDGTPLNTALNISDTVFEIGLTPNRPDCLSFLGIAREVAAIVGAPLRRPEIKIPETYGQIADLSSVTIEAPDLCPRYAARLVTDITIAPSPFWLRERLLSIGLKPINNVVDVTNFVMMELGQPLHAFDFDRLTENRIVVRKALANELFHTLDGKERRLTDDTLMICDGKKPVAVAGVMGGENSEIEATTTRVLLESAYFNPISIRKTAKHLGLNTDASHRFERGIDPEGTLIAVNRAAQLMAEIGNGRIVGGIIDEYPVPSSFSPIPLSIPRTNRHLGTDLNQRQIANFLQSVEFTVEIKDNETLSVLSPSFRVDVCRPEDLMEEVARLWGYDKICTTFPKISGVTNLPGHGVAIKNQIKDMMAGYGFSESITYSFVAKNACDRLRLPQTDDRRRMLDVLNPISEELAVMRTSLVPGLLEAMSRNLSHQIKNLKIFELGKIFFSNGQDRQPSETEMLAGLWTGAREELNWLEKPTACDFYDLKGVVEDLLQCAGVDGIKFSQIPKADCNYTKAGHSAQILHNQVPIGLVGEVDTEVLSAFNIRQPAFIFELLVPSILSSFENIRKFAPIPRFPFTDRDITLIVDNHVQAGDILEKVKLFGEKLMETIRIIDIYSGSPIPPGKKSISLRIVYRSHVETLSDQQVNHLHQQLTDRIIQKFNATLPV